MKQKLISLTLCLLLVFSFPFTLYADEKLTTSVSLWDDLIPSEDQQKKVGQVTVQYNKVPLSHYQLDLFLENRSFWELDDQLSDTGHYFLHQFTNMFWQANVEFSRIVVWVLEESITLDLVTDIGESIGEGIRTLAGFNMGDLNNRGFYAAFFPLMVVLLGAWVGWKALGKDDSEGATRGLVSAFVVIIGSFLFFQSADDFTKQANTISSEISKSIMGLTMNVADPDQPALSSAEATVQAGNNLWDIMVMKPYKLLQLGSTKVDDERVDKILQTPPEKREALILEETKTHQNQMMTTKNSGTRLGFVFMAMILNVLFGVIVLIISAGIPFFQLYFMFVMLLAPIALTWAIVPEWRDSLYKWASEALGALLMKIALSVLLALYFSFSHALYEFSKDRGYLMMMMLQFILLVLLVWKRKEIFQVVTMPANIRRSGIDLDHVLKQAVEQAKKFEKKPDVPLPKFKKKKPKKPEPQERPVHEFIPTYEAEMLSNEQSEETQFYLNDQAQIEASINDQVEKVEHVKADLHLPENDNPEEHREQEFVTIERENEIENITAKEVAVTKENEVLELRDKQERKEHKENNEEKPILILPSEVKPSE